MSSGSMSLSSVAVSSAAWFDGLDCRRLRSMGLVGLLASCSTFRAGTSPVPRNASWLPRLLFGLGVLLRMNRRRWMLVGGSGGRWLEPQGESTCVCVSARSGLGSMAIAAAVSSPLPSAATVVRFRTAQSKPAAASHFVFALLWHSVRLSALLVSGCGLFPPDRFRHLPVRVFSILVPLAKCRPFAWAAMLSLPPTPAFLLRRPSRPPPLAAHFSRRVLAFRHSARRAGATIELAIVESVPSAIRHRQFGEPRDTASADRPPRRGTTRCKPAAVRTSRATQRPSESTFKTFHFAASGIDQATGRRRSSSPRRYGSGGLRRSSGLPTRPRRANRRGESSRLPVRRNTFAEDRNQAAPQPNQSCRPWH